MTNLLEDVEPVEVSLVPKAANKRKFLLFKSAGESDDEPDKSDEEEHKKSDDSSSGETHDSSEEGAKKGRVEKQPPFEDNQMPDISVGAQNAIIGALKILQEYDEEIPNSAYEGLLELIDQTGRLENVPNMDAPDMIMRSADGGESSVNKEDLEKLPDEVRDVVQALYKEREDFVKKTEKLEKELAERKEKEEIAHFTNVAKAYDRIPAETDDLASALRALKKSDEKAYEVMEKALKGANEAIAKGDLFEEKGSSTGGDGDTSVWGKIEALAEGLIEKDAQLEKTDAIVRVLEQNPELYDEYLSDGKK